MTRTRRWAKAPCTKRFWARARSLRAHHIPYGIVNNHYFDRYRKAKVLVLSDVPQFEDGKVDAVLEYVRNGGSLYLSGHCHPRLLEAIFGLQYTGWTEESVTYVSPTSVGDAYMEGHFTHKYPLVMFERATHRKRDAEGHGSGHADASLYDSEPLLHFGDAFLRYAGYER